MTLTDEEKQNRIRLGPPRYYCPVCIRWPWGFVGGPGGYREVPASEKERGPIIVEGKL